MTFFIYLSSIICLDVIEPINKMYLWKVLALIMSIFCNCLISWPTLRIWVHRFIFWGSWAKKKLRNILGIFKFFMRFYSICSLSLIQICQFLLKFKPLPTMNFRWTPANLIHAMDTTYQLHWMQYEIDTITRRRKRTDFKIKST